MVDYTELINYSREELFEEYCKLFNRFQDLKEENEKDTQKIHEMKRSLETATAAQAYLTQELDQCINSYNSEIKDELEKAKAELVVAKRKYSNLENSFSALQHDYKVLSDDKSKTIRNLEEALKRKQLLCEEDNKNYDEYILRIQTLERENMDLLQQIKDFEECSVHYTLTIAECEKNIEVLKEQIDCLEGNLKSKRADLDEKLQILESTQEQLAEANSKLAMMSASPDNDGRKGNSLFAEVDDQRQAMKQMLLAQKRKFIEMRKVYNESEYEIRRLKRENIAMCSELEACSSIFCNADKIFQEKLNERILILHNQNEELEGKLKWTQERLKNMADEKGVSFFDSMLNFCKKETDDLKIQLHSVRIQNAILEEQLRNSQQNMARWRFESLKSRCVLIDREHLLSEHKIYFKPANAVEYQISKKDQEEAKPRIVTKRRSSLLGDVIHRKSITSSNSPTMKNNEILNNSNIKKEQVDVSINSIITVGSSVENTPEKILCSSEEEQRPCKQECPESVNTIESKTNLNISMGNVNNIYEDKEIPNTNNLVTHKFSKLRVKSLSPMRPSQRSLQELSSNINDPLLPRSILSKDNDLMFKDSCKNVKFSSDGDIIHKLSPDNKLSSSSTKTELSSNNIIKEKRTKSNIVIRRIAINTKRD